MTNIRIRRKDLERALSHYRVGLLKSYCIPPQGLLNRIVFITTTKGEYVFKIALANSSTLHYELKLLDHVRLRTALRVLPTREKRLFVLYGAHKAFLSPRISGRHPKQISKKMLEDVGRFLGEFHKRGKNFHVEAERSQILGTSRTSINKALHYARGAHTKPAKEAARYLAAEIWKYPLPAKLPRGPIHVDVKPENSLFRREKLMGIVDFDNAYNGPLVLDLGVAMSWYGTTRGKFDVKKLRTLYHAYNSKRKLSAVERGYLYNALHFAILRNSLRAVDFLARKKLSERWVHRFLKFYLGAERAFQLSRVEFMLELGIHDLS